MSVPRTPKVQGLHEAGVVELFGSVQTGPKCVVRSDVLIMAKGPALCSPLKGVGFAGSKPQATTSCGSLNQKPT